MSDPIHRLVWRAEAPRVRTALVLGRPRRIHLPQHTVMLESSFRHRLGMNRHLHVWASGGDGPGDQLLVSPFHNPNSAPHVYENGYACFNSVANEHIIGGRPASEVFWGSGFRSLPGWLQAVPPADLVWRAPPTRRPANMPGFAYDAGHRLATWRDETRFTPVRVTAMLLGNVVANGYHSPGQGADDAPLVEVEAPWWPGERVMFARDALELPEVARAAREARELTGGATFALPRGYNNG